MRSNTHWTQALLTACCLALMPTLASAELPIKEFQQAALLMRRLDQRAQVELPDTPPRQDQEHAERIWLATGSAFRKAVADLHRAFKGLHRACEPVYQPDAAAVSYMHFVKLTRRIFRLYGDYSVDGVGHRHLPGTTQLLYSLHLETGRLCKYVEEAIAPRLPDL